ncbi:MULTISPECIES: D-alanine--D-alanine ligase family protein [unclassified Prochlorococcus]|uniref:D-alanine--D-alanine ligase family protein n=1 Tax=unclassified Prochlorococcus TaxID=2627481 RepID=UPI000533AC55|nr:MULTISPECIES: D-alanine--D-alanine ligase family protein [unclassified Prochlorococcus]KGG16263.1 D-alanine--D-alanine ligase A [Prochlorococcus sp. MIT 0603]KGG18003.1 D-alanine--D-alanine ligase A [Prochlorococcus sp. MIT 0602]
MESEITSVGIVFGGVSGEHNVSIKSAKTIVNALRDESNRNKFEVIVLYIDEDGRWLPSSISEEVLRKGSIDISTKEKLEMIPIGLTELPVETQRIQVWFPVLHGPNGEDGTIQGFFKLTRKPFVGSGVLASALGMDKIAMKAAFAKEGLPQVRYCTANAIDLLSENNLSLLIQKIESELGYPCFIKPANLGSSVGVSKAYNKNELLKGLKFAAQFDRRIVIEESLNARELECAVLGKRKIAASCVGEIKLNSDWYDYETKYSANTAEIMIPALIPQDISDKVRNLSLLACKAISAEGIARVDFFYQENKQSILINEINTLPGFTSQSMYPMLWGASGINLSQLVARLVENAKD